MSQLQIGDSRLKNQEQSSSPNLLKNLEASTSKLTSSCTVLIASIRSASPSTSADLQHLVDDIIRDDPFKAQERTGAFDSAGLRTAVVSETGSKLPVGFGAKGGSGASKGIRRVG